MTEEIVKTYNRPHKIDSGLISFNTAEDFRWPKESSRGISNEKAKNFPLSTPQNLDGMA
jgi:hypothetical protein